jgi:hypothetical protein
MRNLFVFLQLFVLVQLRVSAAASMEANFDEIPIIRTVYVDSPGSGMSGYVGNKVTLNGVGFNDITAVLINGIPVSEYTVQSETTIIFAAIAVSGHIEILTRANGGAIFGTEYLDLGYITATSGNWNQNTTWLNGKVPPNTQDTTITIAHEVKAATGLLSVGNLTVIKGAELKLSSVLELYGSFINNGVLNCEGIFRMHPKSSFAGNPPVYSYSSVLQYAGFKGDIQDEWTGNSANAGAGTPSSVIISNGAEVRMPAGKFALESGLNIQDTSIFTMDAADLTIGGNWTKSDAAAFVPGMGTLIFRGSDKQEISGDNTFTNLTINNAKGVAFLGPASISGTFNFILGKAILLKNNLTMLPAATIKGYNTRRYIVTSAKGKLWQKGNSSGIVFPIGNTSYNPVTFRGDSSGSFGVRVADSIPAVFNKEKMVSRMWTVSQSAESGNLNVSAQYNKGEFGKDLDAANAVMGFYGDGGWKADKAALTGLGPFFADSTNLDMAGFGEKEHHLIIGNPADIQPSLEPVPDLPAKEPEPQVQSETSFNVTIRPNPFVKETNIIITSAVGVSVKIYDVTGKLMHKEIVQDAEMQTVSVGSDFPSGVYTAIIFTEVNTKIFRIIKR